MASNFDMNPEKFRNTFQAINHGTVMEAAARNLKKEMMRDAEAAAKAAEGASRAVIDMQDLEQARTRGTPRRLDCLTGRARACARARVAHALSRVPQDEELEQIHRDRIAQMKARRRSARGSGGALHLAPRSRCPPLSLSARRRSARR